MLFGKYLFKSSEGRIVYLMEGCAPVVYNLLERRWRIRHRVDVLKAVFCILQASKGGCFTRSSYAFEVSDRRTDGSLDCVPPASIEIHPATSLAKGIRFMFFLPSFFRLVLQLKFDALLD